MDEDRRAAPLQFGEDRIEATVSEVAAPGVGHQRDAVEFKHVEGVRDLFARSLDVGQRYSSERSEPVWAVAFDVREVRGDLARKGPRSGVVTEVPSRRADRWDSHV